MKAKIIKMSMIAIDRGSPANDLHIHPIQPGTQLVGDRIVTFMLTDLKRKVVQI